METSSTIPQRTLTALGRCVGAIGLGCMGMSWAYRTPDEFDHDGSVALVRTALERGITFLDTADAYGSGHNEQIVGEAIREHPEAVVATKCGYVGSFADGKHTLVKDGSPEHIREACDASLHRLGLEQIELYYLHRVDEKVPLEESWGAMAELVTAGKVRALGLSEVSVGQAESAHAIHPVSAIQSELSLWSRDALESGVVAWTGAHGASFVPFSPLGRGFLTGALKPGEIRREDFRAGQPRFRDEAMARNQRLVDVVRAVAARHDAPQSAVALAWVLAQGEHVVPIPGTTKVDHLDANLAAASLELTAADLAELDAMPAAEGTRY